MFFDEGKSVTQTCMEVGVCRATLFNWVKEIIELIDKEFTTINLEERRADVVYKIKLKQQEITKSNLSVREKFLPRVL